MNNSGLNDNFCAPIYIFHIKRRSYHRYLHIVYRNNKRLLLVWRDIKKCFSF